MINVWPRPAAPRKIIKSKLPFQTICKYATHFLINVYTCPALFQHLDRQRPIRFANSTSCFYVVYKATSCWGTGCKILSPVDDKEANDDTVRDYKPDFIEHSENYVVDVKCNIGTVWLIFHQFM